MVLIKKTDSLQHSSAVNGFNLVNECQSNWSSRFVKNYSGIYQYNSDGAFTDVDGEVDPAGKGYTRPCE